jgi:hypothetical protein
MLRRSTVAAAARRKVAARYSAFNTPPLALAASDGSAQRHSSQHQHQQQAATVGAGGMNIPPSSSVNHVSINASGGHISAIPFADNMTLTYSDNNAVAASSVAAVAAAAAANAATGLSPASISHFSDNSDNNNVNGHHNNNAVTTSASTGGSTNGFPLPSPGATPTATTPSLQLSPHAASVNSALSSDNTNTMSNSALIGGPQFGGGHNIGNMQVATMEHSGNSNGTGSDHMPPHPLAVQEEGPSDDGPPSTTTSLSSNPTTTTMIGYDGVPLHHSLPQHQHNIPLSLSSSSSSSYHPPSPHLPHSMLPPPSSYHHPHAGAPASYHHGIMGAAPLAFGGTLVGMNHLNMGMNMSMNTIARMETPSPRPCSPRPHSPRPHSPRPHSPRPMTPPLSGRIMLANSNNNLSNSGNALSPRSPHGPRSIVISRAAISGGGASTSGGGSTNNGNRRRTYRSRMAHHQLAILLLYGIAATLRAVLSVDPLSSEDIYSPLACITLSILGSMCQLLGASTVVCLFLYVDSIFQGSQRALMRSVRIVFGCIVAIFATSLIMFYVMGAESSPAWSLHNGLLCGIYLSGFFVVSHFMIPILKYLIDATDQPALVTRIIICTRVSQCCCVIVAGSYLAILVSPDFVTDFTLQVVTGFIIRMNECLLSAVTLLFAGRPIILGPARHSYASHNTGGRGNHLSSIGAILGDNGMVVWQPAESVALHGSAAATVSAAAPGTVFVKIGSKQPEFMCFDAGGRPFGQPLSIIAEESSQRAGSAMGMNGPSRSEHRRESMIDVNNNTIIGGGGHVHHHSSGSGSGGQMLPRTSSDGGGGHSASNSLIIPTSVAAAAAAAQQAAANNSPTAAAAAAAAGVAAAVSGYTPPQGRSRSSSLEFLWSGGGPLLPQLLPGVIPLSPAAASAAAAAAAAAAAQGDQPPRTSRGSGSGVVSLAAAAAVAAAATATVTPTGGMSSNVSSGTTTPRSSYLHTKRPLSLDMAVVTSASNQMRASDGTGNSTPASGGGSGGNILVPRWQRSLDDPPTLKLLASAESASPRSHSSILVPAYDAGDVSSIFNGTHMMEDIMNNANNGGGLMPLPTTERERSSSSHAPSRGHHQPHQYSHSHSTGSHHHLHTHSHSGFHIEPCSPGGVPSGTAGSGSGGIYSGPTSSRGTPGTGTPIGGGGSDGSPAMMGMALSPGHHPLAVPSPRPLLSSRATSMQLCNDNIMMDHLPGQLSQLSLPSLPHMVHLSPNQSGASSNALPSPIPLSSSSGLTTPTTTTIHMNMNMARHMHHERAGSDIEMELSMDTLHMPSVIDSLLQPVP